jgi:hypothetical protein
MLWETLHKHLLVDWMISWKEAEEKKEGLTERWVGELPACQKSRVPYTATAGGNGWPWGTPGHKLTYRSPHLCCSHTKGNPSPPPCLWQFSVAGQQKIGDLHTDWGPGRKKGTGRNTVKITPQIQVQPPEWWAVYPWCSAKIIGLFFSFPCVPDTNCVPL